MRLKNKILGITVLAATLSMVGCSDDFLDEKKNYTKFGDEDVFNNTITVNWYVNKLYYDFYSSYTSPAQSIAGQNTGDWNVYTEEYGGISEYVSTAETVEASALPNYLGSITSSVQNNAYSRIRTINTMLEKLDPALGEVYCNKIKGQMYFMRGLQYYELVRCYGGVPLVFTVLNPEAENISIKYPRAATSECIDSICADFDRAAAMLPSKWESSEYGRFTKGAALAMKSRVLLLWASPLFNRTMEDARWTKALNASLAAETELSANGVGLYGEDAPGVNGAAWNKMFVMGSKERMNLGSNNEAIIIVQSSTATSTTRWSGWENTIRLSSQGGSGGVKAPMEMVNLFPLADGSRPTEANGYDAEHFYMNRDPRFYRTFAFTGCKWPSSTEPDEVVWAYRWGTKVTPNETTGSNDTTFSSSDNNSVHTLAFVRKMSEDENSPETFKYSGLDLCEYRYAELLLNVAECYAALGQTSKTVEYLSRIRKRAGLPDANNYGIGTLANKEAAIEACLYERQVELAYEGKRFWDIRRWMLYNDDLTANNETCASLKVKPLNGTCRTGMYLQVKDELYTLGTADPLKDSRGNISVDPDAADFAAQLDALKAFWDANFMYRAPETPMDNINGEAAVIDWKQNYYIFGLPTSVLEANTWLLQNKGWNDIYEVEGTFDPLL